MKFCYKTAMENAKITLTEKNITPDIYHIDVDITFDEPTIPSPVKIEWYVPCVDAYSVLAPEDQYRRNLQPSWNRRFNTSCCPYGCPYQQIISASGQNRMTISLSDGIVPAEISTGVKESRVAFRCNVTIFTEPTDKITEYHATVYVDTTDRPYHESLFALQDFFRESGYVEPYFPEDARSALYSTWYAFHQGVTASNVLEECREAVKYGMKMVILDDGWQKVYSDWSVDTNKFPDMGQFVSDIHALGMKCMLWIAIPFLEPTAECFERFRDMSLTPTAQGTHQMFDPRYPEVREYLCKRLGEIASEWKFDGFKIDFVDYFRLYPDTPKLDSRRDTESVFLSVDYLMRELTTTLRAINPDFMLEFRQPYYSPAICSYASMVRVGDCAADTLENHTRGIALRYSVGKLPVHSDMLIWNPLDTVENAARQVISTLFLVPQISVRFENITEEQRAMLAFYLKFRNENIPTLMDGKFEAENPELLYPMVTSRKDGHQISVSYGKTVLKADPFKKLHYINSSGETEHFIKASEDMGTFDYTVFTCTGEIVSQGTCTVSRGMNAFEVPVCGMLALTAKE